MPETAHLPYEAMLEIGVLLRDVNEAWQGLAAIENRLAKLIDVLAGPLASDAASDEFWDQFGRDVDGRADG